MSIYRLLISLWIMWLPVGAVAEGFDDMLGIPKQTFLDPQQAFGATAKIQGDTLHTTIKLADKIHAYINKLKYKITKPTKVTLTFDKPKAVKIEDDPDPVFYGTHDIDIPIKQLRDHGIKGSFTLSIYIQGCSDAGICYNPQVRQFDLKMPPDAAKSSDDDLEGLAEESTLNPKAWDNAQADDHTKQKATQPAQDEGLFAKIARLTKEGNTAKIADVLTHESSFFILFLFFIFGLMLALTPCVFPMIPILSSIIVSQAGKDKTPSKGAAFVTSLIYVLAMAMTYTIVGVAAGLLGADIQAAFAKPWVIVLFSFVFVALAFSLFGYYEIGLPASWQSKLTKVSDGAQNKGIMGTAIMGALSALIVGPCVAPPLGGAILFISQSGDAWLGGWALFIMSIGMGMPLLLVGLGAGKFMPRPGGWMTRVSETFGVLMLAMALYMLRSLISESMLMLLSSLLLMGSALYMNPFETSTARGALRLFKLLAMTLFVYGVLLFVGWVSGSTSLLNPLDRLSGGGSATVETHKPVDRASRQGYSYARLMEEVKSAGKPVIVDIAKANCAACTELEEITFPDPAVKDAMKRFKFIQIDITKYTADDADLLKQFHLFGAPNLLFFDGEGNPLPQKFLTGFVKPEKLVEHLKSIK